MKKRDALLIVLLFLLLTLVFNTFQRKEVINLILSLVSFTTLLLYLRIKDEIKLVISKSIIFTKYGKKKINDHYVIFLEISNLMTYSQFYDINLSDHIMKQIHNQLVKKVGRNHVFLYSTNQIVIILEFKNTAVINQLLRYEEQYRSTRQILNYVSKLKYRINKKEENYETSLVAGCSAIGIKMDITNIDALIKLAHFSMLRAKKLEDDIVVANDEIHTIKQDLDSFNHEIVNGVHLDEFSPFFLPIIDVNSNMVVGCESLVRWRKNKYRIIETSKFKDIAIEKNLFEKIDKRVIEKTFFAYSKWQKNDIVSKDFRITINLSLKSLLSYKPYELVHLASDYKIEPKNIEFDISEDDISSDRAIHAINNLKKAHFKVSIDAFNTKSFSPKALMNIDFDILKIDKSNLPGSNLTKKEDRFYRTLIRFAKIMNLRVLSKGIENKNHLKFARQFNVDYVQGYYFTPPLDEVNILIYLKKYKNGILTP